MMGQGLAGGSLPSGGLNTDEGVRAYLVEIERHLADATLGTHQRDCAGRIFANIDGEEMQIGEAYAQGDARLWRHAAANIR